MRTKLIILLILVIPGINTFCQMLRNEIIVPPNLTANKLENCNIDKPNLYSGTVDDNIPIYEIKIKNFSMPIVLNHNYNGFKPAESASWVGLGWNLRVGGSISRIINNRPDEDQSGYKPISDVLNIPDPVNTAAAFNSFTTNLTQDQLKSFAEGWWDGLPDEYMLSVNDINAKFIQLRNGNYATIPFRPIQISTSNPWIVQDESGNKYYFGKLTSNDVNGVEESNSVTSTNPDAGEDMSCDAITKYVLRKIELITGETIIFNYESETVIYDSAISETKYYPKPFNYISQYGDPGLPFQQYCSTNTLHTFCRLVSIETPYEKVNFIKGDLRKDLNSTNSYPLKEVQVQNSQNNTVKGWLFYNSPMGDIANYSTCRLMLDSIVEYGSTSSIRKPAYSFSYEKSNVIPTYTSKSIDHWGYYNGANNNTLVPKIIENSNYNNVFTDGGDREPNHNYSKIGLLTQVKLPTKGLLNYQYEPNSYGYINHTAVNDIVYDSFTAEANAISTGNATTTANSFTIIENQTINIDYILRAYRKVGNTIPTDVEPPYIRITKDISSTQNDYYLSNTNAEIISGSVTKYLSAGTYYIEANALTTDQVANIKVIYTKVRKDGNGNTVYIKNKLTGGHRVIQLIKQDTSTGGNNITQTIAYTCGTDATRSSGVLVNVPNYEYEFTKINLDFRPSSIPHPIQFPDLYYTARTSNSTRPLVSDDSHINYSEVTAISNQNLKSISYFTSGIDFEDITYPRNASNVSKSYKRGLLTKETQFKDLTQQVKSVDYNYNFSRTDNKSGIGGIFLVEYLHKSIDGAINPDGTLEPLSTFKEPWAGKIISEWIPLESTVELADAVSKTNNYYYDNPVHAQVTRTKADNTEETYTYTLYSYDYSNTGTGDFIGEMKSAHILNKPIEKVTYVKDKISGNLYVTDGEIYTYKTGSHVGQLESIYKLKNQTAIPISTFKFSNRSVVGEMPHVNNFYATFSLGNIDGNYNTEPEQKVTLYDTYNNPQEFRNKDNSITSYLWSYNQMYSVAKGENIDYNTLNSVVLSIQSDLQGYLSNTIGDLTTDAQKSAWNTFNTTLRGNSLLKDAMITTYTYKPLVGMTSSTDPRGVTTYYWYDTTNRLKETYIVENGVKKILKKYDYHYQNQ